ncbi:hypothetical protein [Streptomyces sp. NPDC006012]|uniref:hypothetical protein n=1 Tax=Streptomyces sp. NPDC006012 TaxID=3364739 RepID=UPI0036B2BA54
MRLILAGPALAAALLTITACRSTAHSGPRHAALPANAVPCASRSQTPSVKPEPIQTKLEWRAEELRDSSVRMTIGDVSLAPEDAKAVRVTDYHAPGSETACDYVKITAAHGWWCSTTVSPVAVNGEIVVGGAQPRAQIHSAGFRTHRSGRTAKMRQHYTIERDSWSGWRPYDDRGRTNWTSQQDQSGHRVSAPCPQGRVGSYDYRLAVSVEIDGIQADESSAASTEIRTHCGTGVS